MENGYPLCFFLCDFLPVLQCFGLKTRVPSFYYDFNHTKQYLFTNFPDTSRYCCLM